MTWISFRKSVIVILFWLFLSDKKEGIITETKSSNIPSM